MEPSPPKIAPQDVRVRKELVMRILAFLKQYYMFGQDAQAISMLKSIVQGGSREQSLGRELGVLNAKELDKVLEFFETWKQSGCRGMSAYYFSPTHKKDIPCIVKRRNPDGTLDLMSPEGPKGGAIKTQARANLVKPRLVDGWFLPIVEKDHQESLELVDEKEIMRKDEAAAVASPEAVSSSLQQSDSSAPKKASDSAVAKSTEHPVSSSDANVDLPTTTTSQPKAAVAEIPKPPQSEAMKLFRVKFAFDGTQYGEEYLSISANDLLDFTREEEGWCYGRIVQRAGTALITQTEGWYPPGYAEPFASMRW